MTQDHERGFLQAIDDKHIQLDEIWQAVLVARVAGISISEMSGRSFKHTRTIGGYLERADDHVCFPLDRPKSVALSNFWLGRHATCSEGCVARGFELLASDKLFEAIAIGPIRGKRSR